MKLETFIKCEELKDALSYIVKQSKNSKDKISMLDNNLIEPASELITRILAAYDDITEELGESAAASYGFNIMSNYIMLSMKLAADNILLEEKLKEKENE